MQKDRRWARFVIFLTIVIIALVVVVAAKSATQPKYYALTATVQPQVNNTGDTLSYLLSVTNHSPKQTIGVKLFYDQNLVLKHSSQRLTTDQMYEQTGPQSAWHVQVKPGETDSIVLTFVKHFIQIWASGSQTLTLGKDYNPAFFMIDTRNGAMLVINTMEPMLGGK